MNLRTLLFFAGIIFCSHSSFAAFPVTSAPIVGVDQQSDDYASIEQSLVEMEYEANPALFTLVADKGDEVVRPGCFPHFFGESEVEKARHCCRYGYTKSHKSHCTGHRTFGCSSFVHLWCNYPPGTWAPFRQVYRGGPHG